MFKCFDFNVHHYLFHDLSLNITKTPSWSTCGKLQRTGCKNKMKIDDVFKHPTSPRCSQNPSSQQVTSKPIQISKQRWANANSRGFKLTFVWSGLNLTLSELKQDKNWARPARLQPDLKFGQVQLDEMFRWALIFRWFASNCDRIWSLFNR